MEHLMNDFPPEFAAFSDQSRVWIYPASRLLSDIEIAEIQQQINQFCSQWTAHQQALRAMGWISEGRLLILAVDESNAGASGCSIDKSVSFLQKIGQQYNIDFFDRLTFYYKADDSQICPIHFSQLSQHVEDGTISSKTLFINTLASDKIQLFHYWVPFEDSWQYKMLNR